MYLKHAGKKGMRWGYNDGKKNGKRTAEDDVHDHVMIPSSEIATDLKERSALVSEAKYYNKRVRDLEKEIKFREEFRINADQEKDMMKSAEKYVSELIVEIDKIDEKYRKTSDGPGGVEYFAKAWLNETFGIDC